MEITTLLKLIKDPANPCIIGDEAFFANVIWSPILLTSNITEQAYSSLLNFYLSLEERDIIDQYFRNRQRQLQYLQARILTKDLYFQNNIQQQAGNKSLYQNITIASIPNGIKKGKPFISSSDDEQHFDVSISHNNSYTASALGSNCQVGLDVERICDVKKSFLEMVFCESELNCIWQLAKQRNYEQTVSLFWTIKEAIVKSLGVGFRLGLRSLTLSLNDDNVLNIRFNKEYKDFLDIKNQELLVYTTFIGKNCLALCLIKRT